MTDALPFATAVAAAADFDASMSRVHAAIQRDVAANLRRLHEAIGEVCLEALGRDDVGVLVTTGGVGQWAVELSRDVAPRTIAYRLTLANHLPGGYGDA